MILREFFVAKFVGEELGSLGVCHVRTLHSGVTVLVATSCTERVLILESSVVKWLWGV
jgi:hypothetical protein